MKYFKKSIHPPPANPGSVTDSEDYVQYGLTFITDKDGIQRPKCFLCDKVLSNGRRGCGQNEFVHRGGREKSLRTTEVQFHRKGPE